MQVSIKRRGFDDLIELTVERDEVNIPSLQGAFMIDERTGYIRLRDFSEVTDRELGKELTKLQSRGMQRLLLDLRDNPGGPLDQAIRVSNRFLPRGDMIVYTRGRTRHSDEDYHASEPATVPSPPIIVLVNRNSASASEIVGRAAGSRSRPGRRRDHVRQGPGAVPLPHRRRSGLALTTARYYTPSGRMIQRPWDGTFDETYSYREQGDQPREHKGNELKHTDAGRQVYGGGGIEPDRHMTGPIEGFNPAVSGARCTAARSSPTSHSASRSRATPGSSAARTGASWRATSPSTRRCWPISRAS